MPEERFREKRGRRDDDDEERPRRRARRDEEDDEDERPRRRARRDEENDDYDRPRRGSRRRDKPAGINSLIPYKNPQALIAYYLGVFALIPGAFTIALCVLRTPQELIAGDLGMLALVPGLGGLLAVIAIVLGILGLGYRSKNPTAGGTGHAWAGIVLGTLVLFVHLGLVVFLGNR